MRRGAWAFRFLAAPLLSKARFAAKLDLRRACARGKVEERRRSVSAQGMQVVAAAATTTCGGRAAAAAAAAGGGRRAAAAAVAAVAAVAVAYHAALDARLKKDRCTQGRLDLIEHTDLAREDEVVAVTLVALPEEDRVHCAVLTHLHANDQLLERHLFWKLYTFGPAQDRALIGRRAF